MKDVTMGVVATTVMLVIFITLIYGLTQLQHDGNTNYNEVVRKAKSRADAAGENTACFWQMKEGAVVVEVYNVPCKAWPGQPAWAKTPNLVITWPDGESSEGE